MASALSLKLVLEPHFHQFMLDSCMATHYSQYSITFPSGVVTALVTPLQVNGRLDGLGLDRLIEAQISAGVNGIFILGSVGEGPLLADDVANEVVRRTVARVARRVTVYAGASDNSVVRCRHRIDRLATHGVDYAVLTLPYYNWPERVGESVRFFARVAADSPLPLLAYNLPKAVGWRMPVAAIEELYEIPNLAGLKDTHGELADLEAVASSPRRPPHFSYLIGNSSLAGRLFRKGANGVVTTPANVYPAPFVALWAAYREGRFNLLDTIDREWIAPVVRLLDAMPTGASAIKGMLELQGVCQCHTVAPWPEADKEDLARLEVVRASIEADLARSTQLAAIQPVAKSGNTNAALSAAG